MSKNNKTIIIKWNKKILVTGYGDSSQVKMGSSGTICFNTFVVLSSTLKAISKTPVWSVKNFGRLKRLLALKLSEYGMGNVAGRGDGRFWPFDCPVVVVIVYLIIVTYGCVFID
jgi:hypothetical protein